MKFCCIIPDRNDRPELTKFCFQQLNRMTLQPDKVYWINHAPISNNFDLVDRIRKGVQIAKEEGFDLCFVLENDDSYKADYFERFAPYFDKYDFFGQEYSIYYNLRNQTYNRFDHKYRSSLMTTGFKISSLARFDWPDADTRFLDIELWKYARHKKRVFIDTGAIGVKHGLGKCGGKGHQMYWPKNFDKDFNQLKKMVDSEAFEFYRDLSTKLQGTWIASH